MAHLQAHQTGEKSQSFQGQDSPEEISARNLCVSQRHTLNQKKTVFPTLVPALNKKSKSGYFRKFLRLQKTKY